MSELVKRIAMCRAYLEAETQKYVKLSVSKEDLDTILAALSQTAREGMVLVPREPTDEMIEAASEAWFKSGGTWAGVYQAIIEATSTPAKEGN